MPQEIKYFLFPIAADPAKVDQKRFNFLEYYKVKFKTDWYTKVYGKFVLRALTEFGFLGAIIKMRVSSF
jgi:outer membrane protein insertion porin family